MVARLHPDNIRRKNARVPDVNKEFTFVDIVLYPKRKHWVRGEFVKLTTSADIGSQFRISCVWFQTDRTNIYIEVFETERSQI